MKTLSKPVLLFLPLVIWGVILPFQTTIAPQVIVSPTPTYDPFVETPLPPNPTEFELGQNLYWHWCMTCHGDRGQGLTDEFRGLWDVDHQNCWGRGCHVGRKGDEGFPIPTVVPALVDEEHLSRFSSLQGLANFLKATHPPQSPGILKDEEYHAIALFVFSMNERDAVNAPVIPASTPTPNLIPSEEAASDPNHFPISTIGIVGVLMIIILVVVRKLNVRKMNTEPDGKE